MQSSSQVRARNLRDRLNRAGIHHTLTTKPDGITRVWIVGGRRLGTRAAERYAAEVEQSAEVA